MKTKEIFDPNFFFLSEETYYSIFENTGTATVIIEEDTTISLANREFCRLSGYSKKELEGKKSWKEFVVSTKNLDQMEKIHHMRRTHPESVPERYEFVFRDKMGQIKYVSVKGGHLPGTKRNIVSLTNITELKQKENYLLESKEFSYTLLDNLPNPVFVLNPDSSIEYVNPALEEKVGYTLAELKGMKAPYPWWTELTRPRLEGNFEEIVQKGVRKREEVFQDKSGQRFYVELTGIPVLDEKGGLRYYISNWTDISLYKQKEEALKESESKFRFLAEHSADIIWSLDADLAFTYVSPSVEKILGYSQKEAMGMSLDKVLSTCSYNRVMKLYNQVIADKITATNTMNLQLEHIHKDGYKILGDVHVTLLYDQKKQLIGVQGVTRDITAQRKAEQALKESEERYRTLVEHQMEAVCRWLPDTTLTYVNEGYCRFFGKTRQEIIGEKFISLVDESEQGSIMDYVQSLVKDPKIDVIEHKAKGEDGQAFWQEWINSPIFDGKGNLIEFQGIGRDITKRVKAEEALWVSRHALESSINGIVLMDLYGKISYVNPSFLIMSQCKDKDEVLGRYFGKYFEDKEIGGQIIETLFEKGFWRGELRFKRQDLTLSYIELSANLVMNPRREPVCIMSSFIDISARKETEMKLKKSYDHLEKRVDERTRELKEANLALKNEISERLESERALKEKSEEQELLLNNIDTQIWYLSDPKTYRLINRSRADFLGQYQLSSKGKNLFEIMDKKVAEVCLANNQTVYRDKASLRSEEWHKNKDGQNCLLSVVRTPKLDDKENVQYIICVANDITETREARKELEKNRDQLVRSQKVAQVATWEVDYQTGEVFFSDQQYRLFGYQPQDIELDLRTIKKHIHPDDINLMRQFIREPRYSAGPFDIKFRYYTKNREERIGHLIGETDQDEQGRNLRIYGTMQDVTEHVHIEQELVKARKSYQNLLQSIQQRKQFHNIIGINEQMQKIYSLIQQLAVVDSTVLIRGESGTGKELVVEALHYTGHRADGPLIKINASALSEGLLDSELFGHVRGAFTGAERDKIGRIQAAEGGTLFLDEIGDISPSMQLKLLRFLEEKEFERVGDSKTLKSNTRVVAATNVDLYQKVKEGTFRKDLYFRLNVINIYVPPLIERRDDIPLLVNHFVKYYKESFKKNITGVSKEVLNVFMNYHWPGNVRELKHIIEHASILCQGGEIGPEHLPNEFFEEQEKNNEAPKGASKVSISKEQIVEALELAEGNKIKAAKILGVSRRTLYRKMHKYNMVEEKRAMVR